MARFQWTRRHRVLVGTLAALIVAFLVFTLVLFVRPATNAPERVDAIVVLGGSGDRVQKGLTLARDGYAPVLVVSNTWPNPCPKAPAGVQVICFTPNPASTRGEARAVARLAAVHHWQRLLLIPSVPQTTRARIRFARCFHGVLLFDPASPGGLGQWLLNVPYEWAALTKALIFQRGC